MGSTPISRSMSAERGEIHEVFGEDTILTEHVRRRIEAAQKLVETCGCVHCRKYLQSWLDWRNLVVRNKGEDLPPFPTSPGADDVGPDHPKFGPDDPPLSLDSGNLADWYAAGL